MAPYGVNPVQRVTANSDHQSLSRFAKTTTMLVAA
jgi:hypothetical protein